MAWLFGLVATGQAQDGGVAAEAAAPVETPAEEGGGGAEPGGGADPTRGARRRGRRPRGVPGGPGRPGAGVGAPLDGGVDAGAALDGGAAPLDAAADGGGPLAPLDAGPPPDAGPPDAGAGAPDAGAPDAGWVQAADPEQPEPDRDLIDVLRDRLGLSQLFEQSERAEAEARRASERAAESPSVTVAPAPAPEQVAVRVVGCDAGPAFSGLLPERALSFGQLLLLLGLALFAVFVVGRLRRPLPERGALPRTLGIAHLLLRLVVVTLIVMLLTRLLPSWLRPALLLAVAAAAVAIGFGIVWVVLPDVVSGILLVTEARVRRGLWISGDGFEGTVERVGPRLTVLHDPEGHVLTVPNRQLVRSAIHAVDRRWPELRLSLRVPTARPAREVRRAVEDAVLCSPHLPPDPRLSVARDAEDPQLWRIHVRLLEVTHREDFEGQLLERIEEALEAPARRAEE